jgi:hypothetical protein
MIVRMSRKTIYSICPKAVSFPHLGLINDSTGEAARESVFAKGVKSRIGSRPLKREARTRPSEGAEQ